MEKIADTPHTVSVYSTPTRVLAAIAWGFCAFLALNLILTGTPASIWHFLPWLLLTAWGIHVLLWRPRLLIRSDGLAVSNILRDHKIPFGDLIAMRVLQTVSFDTTAGRIASWGAPGSGKLGPKMRTDARGARTAASLPYTQTLIQTAWDAWELSPTAKGKHDGGAPSPSLSSPHVSLGAQPGTQPGTQQGVASRWNMPTAVVGVLLAVLTLASMIT
ncbi:hypothetical protein [Arthrobacter sp.]|uniref:hypothetical protein n=1 Tax=Arthrobacter sp. TaxID=1667 RepID=UPI0026DF4B8C|nr:hypothetical protein [Arthrobacter sp.]MDO5751976.1 hypothetical protein [Arthrobacter sp.]